MPPRLCLAEKKQVSLVLKNILSEKKAMIKVTYAESEFLQGRYGRTSGLTQVNRAVKLQAYLARRFGAYAD